MRLRWLRIADAPGGGRWPILGVVPDPCRSRTCGAHSRLSRELRCTVFFAAAREPPAGRQRSAAPGSPHSGTREPLVDHLARAIELSRLDGLASPGSSKAKPFGPQRPFVLCPGRFDTGSEL